MRREQSITIKCSHDLQCKKVVEKDFFSNFKIWKGYSRELYNPENKNYSTGTNDVNGEIMQAQVENFWMKC